MALTRSEKILRYETAATEIAAVVAGESDAVARMATVASMLASAFDGVSWCGFYRVDPRKDQELVIGPYQGPLGCLRIAFGRGVCGAAAARRETVVVADVHEFPDHIACDATARSEIVVPVFDGAGALLAVLDVDSRDTGTFDEVDAEHLRSLMDGVFRAEAETPYRSLARVASPLGEDDEATARVPSSPSGGSDSPAGER